MPNSNKKCVVEKVAFASGNFLLQGCLHLPPAARPPVVIGSHGLFSDKNSPKQIELAKRCCQNNIAYFRFDHRGCGDSKASFKELTSLEARCMDLIAAVNMLKARVDIGARMALFGSSMGGSVCLLAAARYIETDAVITWAAPIRSTAMVRDRTSPHYRDARTDSSSPFKNNPFDISDQLAGVRNILIFHGDADETVPLPHAEEIYERTAEPKKLVVFPQSDHRMSHPADQQLFMQQAGLWLQARLKPANKQTPID